MATQRAANAKQLQSERTRRVLIDAATALLLRNGYARTTLALLAAEVGMTKGDIYHHFTNKEALLRAVIEDVRATWEREVAGRIPVEGSALAQVEELFDHQTRLINANPSLCLLVHGLLLESEAIGQEMVAAIQEIYADFTLFVRGILTRGQRSGEVRRDVAAEPLARAIVAIIRSLSCSRETDPSARAFARKMQTTRTVLVAGLRP